MSQSPRSSNTLKLKWNIHFSFSFRSFALKWLISLQNYYSFDRKKSEFDTKVLTKAHNPPSLFLIFNASLLKSVITQQKNNIEVRLYKNVFYIIAMIWIFHSLLQYLQYLFYFLEAI